MKRLIFILVIVVLFFSSCDDNEGALGWHNEISSKGLKKAHKVIELGECEYIMYDAGSGYSGNGFFAHKGDCHNPIHCHNQK